MEHHVDREGEAELLHEGRGRALLLHRSDAGDPLGDRGVGVLDRDLDVLEPGVPEPLGAGSREPEAGGDERAVEPEAAGVGGQLLEVLSDQRLAAGEAELQHAQRARLGEDALPVLGGDLAVCPDQVQRIGAVRTVQRAAVRQLRQQRGRAFTGHGSAPGPPDASGTRSRRR